MTIEQYKEEIKLLNSEFQKRKNRLDEEFAFANNPYNVGDVFTDHIGKIRVESIRVTIHNNIPYCAFFGTELKKDGTPTKKGSKREAYKVNEVK